MRRAKTEVLCYPRQRELVQAYEFDTIQPGPALAHDPDGPVREVAGGAVGHGDIRLALDKRQKAREIDAGAAPSPLVASITTNAVGLIDVRPNLALDPFQFIQ